MYIFSLFDTYYSPEELDLIVTKCVFVYVLLMVFFSASKLLLGGAMAGGRLNESNDDK